MTVEIAVLLVCILIVVVSIRSRAVLPALVSGAVVLLIVCSMFSGLADGFAHGLQGVSDAGSHVVSAVGE